MKSSTTVNLACLQKRLHTPGLKIQFQNFWFRFVGLKIWLRNSRLDFVGLKIWLRN